MAKTATQRVREMRERRAKELEQRPDLTLPWVRGSFQDYCEDVTFSFEETLDSLGVRFEGDMVAQEQTIETAAGPREIDGLSRLTALAGAFADAAQEAAAIVNRFKSEELRRRISEIEASDLGDPEVRKRSLDDIVKLKNMLDELSRERRVGLPLTELKG